MMDKKKLSKLAMPEKRKEDLELDELDLEMAAEEDAEEMAPEMEEMEEGEMEVADEDQEEPVLAEKLSDDELLAEIKKRGLMSQLDDQDAEDQEIYS